MREKIIEELGKRLWTVNRLHEETGIRYNSLNDFIKHNKGIGFNNLETVCECLSLKLVNLV